MNKRKSNTAKTKDTQAVSGIPHEQSSLDIQKLLNEYSTAAPKYKRLAEEVAFILSEGIEEKGIKIHDIESRVKEFDSLIRKCADKEIDDPFSNLSDICGVRVICLFRSTLQELQKIIAENFVVIECDDKVSESVDSFGYMSVHYICQLSDNLEGPRYRKLKGLQFEIQVRTLSMHAWATISHYIDYKGDWDVPVHLRKALNALSGLFYVADSEFEQFYIERERSRSTISDVSSSENELTELNLDTMERYLNSIADGRELLIRDNAVSVLVKDLKDLKYDSIEAIDRDVQRASKAFIKYENMLSSTGIKPKITAVGLVRISILLGNKDYREKLNISAKMKDMLDKCAPLLID